MWPERAKFREGAAVNEPSELRNSAVESGLVVPVPPAISTRPSVSSTAVAPVRGESIVPAASQVPVGGAERLEPLTNSAIPMSVSPIVARK